MTRGPQYCKKTVVYENGAETLSWWHGKKTFTLFASRWTDELMRGPKALRKITAERYDWDKYDDLLLYLIAACSVRETVSNNEESANVLTAVTSHVNHMSLHQGTRVKLSGLFFVQASEVNWLLIGWNDSRENALWMMTLRACCLVSGRSTWGSQTVKITSERRPSSQRDQCNYINIITQ